jgi:hypothetical protein
MKKLFKRFWNYFFGPRYHILEPREISKKLHEIDHSILPGIDAEELERQRKENELKDETAVDDLRDL